MTSDSLFESVAVSKDLKEILSFLPQRTTRTSGCSVTVLLVLSHTELRGMELTSHTWHIPFLFLSWVWQRCILLKTSCSTGYRSLFVPERHLM